MQEQRTSKTPIQLKTVYLNRTPPKATLKFRQTNFQVHSAQSTHFSSLVSVFVSFFCFVIYCFFLNYLARFPLARENVCTLQKRYFIYRDIKSPLTEFPPEMILLINIMSSSEVRVTSVIGCEFSVHYF